MAAEAIVEALRLLWMVEADLGTAPSDRLWPLSWLQRPLPAGGPIPGISPGSFGQCCLDDMTCLQGLYCGGPLGDASQR